MRVLYSIFTHNGESAIYKGLTMSAQHATEHLQANGHRVKKQNVSDLGHGKRWSNKVIIIRHLVDEHTLLTPALIQSLKFEGEREAKQKLKDRKK